MVAAAVTLDHQGCTACPSSRAQGRPPFLGEAVHLLREDWFVRFQGVEGGEERGRRPGELLKRTQVYHCFSDQRQSKGILKPQVGEPVHPDEISLDFLERKIFIRNSLQSESGW